MAVNIRNPVGKWESKPELKVRNQYEDVRAVQRLLCIAANSLQNPQFHPGSKASQLAFDGIIGRASSSSSTVKAIMAFQKTFWGSPDGLIEPLTNKPNTLSRLNDTASKVPQIAESYKLETLNADFRIKANLVLKEMQDLGWHLRIVWGRRTKAENDELVDAGTASRTSKHLDGLAVDLIDRRVAYSSKRRHQYYLDLEQACKSFGLTWGGNFKKRWDPTHFEEAGLPVGAVSQGPSSQGEAC